MADIRVIRSRCASFCPMMAKQPCCRAPQTSAATPTLAEMAQYFLIWACRGEEKPRNVNPQTPNKIRDTEAASNLVTGQALASANCVHWLTKLQKAGYQDAFKLIHHSSLQYRL